MFNNNFEFLISVFWICPSFRVSSSKLVLVFPGKPDRLLVLIFLTSMSKEISNFSGRFKTGFYPLNYYFKRQNNPTNVCSRINCSISLHRCIGPSAIQVQICLLLSFRQHGPYTASWTDSRLFTGPGRKCVRHAFVNSFRSRQETTTAATILFLIFLWHIRKRQRNYYRITLNHALVYILLLLYSTCTDLLILNQNEYYKLLFYSI